MERCDQRKHVAGQQAYESPLLSSNRQRSRHPWCIDWHVFSGSVQNLVREDLMRVALTFRSYLSSLSRAAPSFCYWTSPSYLWMEIQAAILLHPIASCPTPIHSIKILFIRLTAMTMIKMVDDNHPQLGTSQKQQRDVRRCETRRSHTLTFFQHTTRYDKVDLTLRIISCLFSCIYVWLYFSGHSTHSYGSEVNPIISVNSTQQGITFSTHELELLQWAEAYDDRKLEGLLSLMSSHSTGWSIQPEEWEPRAMETVLELINARYTHCGVNH